jgi:hypothetical protein
VDTPRVIENPWALLTQAFDRLAASPVWTVTLRAGCVGADMGVRPGLQWFDMGDMLEAAGSAVLVRDGFAYLQGRMLQSSMLGYTRSPDSIDAVVGNRWLQCDAAAFERAGNDHHVLEQLAKQARPEPRQRVTVRQIQNSADGPVALLLANGGVCAVLLSASGPVLTGLGHAPHGPVEADISYHDIPLPLPDLDERGVISFADAMTGFAARRRRPTAKKRRSKLSPTLQVSPPDDSEQTWNVRSDDLIGWGAETGYDVEQQARELLAGHRPDLLADIEFDSNAESFLAYAPTEAAAQTLANEMIKHHL